MNFARAVDKKNACRPPAALGLGEPKKPCYGEALAFHGMDLNAPMKNAAWWVVLVLAGIAAGVYYWWQRQEPQPPPPPVAEAPPPPQAPAEPKIMHPIQETPGERAKPLPALDASDPAMREALAGLVGQKPFAQLFHPDALIRHIVVTVDNLPRKKVARRLAPVKPVPGAFVVSGTEGGPFLGADNAARYQPYVRLAELIDARKAAALYADLYPLFQQAYMELGYPDRYFNDRLVEVIDHLLAAPEVQGPVKLVQPKVMYEFADPELEGLSAGQKILIRMGGDNSARIKAKLREIRRELTARPPQR